MQDLDQIISVSGDGISYNSSTGVISLAVGSDDITEETNNLFFTNARSRSALSVGAAGAEDVQLLTYNSTSGAMSVLLSDVFNEFTAGTGLSFDGGEYSLNATTSNVAEGSRLYYTDARSRGGISVSGDGITIHQRVLSR